MSPSVLKMNSVKDVYLTGNFKSGVSNSVASVQSMSSEQRVDAAGYVLGALTTQAAFSTAVGGTVGGLRAMDGAAPATRSYNSFSEYKRNEGSAGPGKDWHHIVEQNPANKAQFSPQQLQNTNNIVSLPKDVHRQISGYYSSKSAGPGSATRRQIISQQNFSTQMEMGKEVMSRVINIR